MNPNAFDPTRPSPQLPVLPIAGADATGPGLPQLLDAMSDAVVVVDRQLRRGARGVEGVRVHGV